MIQTTLLFRRIRYKNLLSTGNIFSEIDLSLSPMTLVVGDNGEGKSTLIDAVCFVLFKKSFRKVNLPQLVNWVTKREMVVEIEFRARGHEYRIVRGLKPAVFEIYKDGDLLNQPGATKDYQQDLEKYILRTNFKTFSQIVILGSASYVPFMQLKPHERRPIIEDIYDCGIFTVMKSLLTTKLTLVEKEVNSLENERDMLLQKLEMSKRHQNVVTEDKQKWIEAKEGQMSTLEQNIVDSTSELKRLHDENALMQPVIEEEKKLSAKMTELSTLKTKIFNNCYNLEKEKVWLETHEDCPTCKQVINPIFRAEVVREKDVKIAEITDGLKKLGDKISDTTDECKKLSYAMSKVTFNKTHEYVVHSQVATYRGQIADLAREVNRLTSEQEEVVDEASIIELESELTQKKREAATLVREREMMNYVGILLKDSGIKAKIIMKYSSTFNQLINAYLAKLDFFVDFHLDEEFEETIKSLGRDNFSYNSFSEGEKLRIDLAVLFAWRDIAKMRASLNTNLLIMDEIFDGSLDSAGVEELLKVMKRVTEGNNVFVISHQIDRLDGHFDRKLRFSKTRGFSKIAE